ncbi:tetratricopeptide repeat protein [Bacillus sp. REN3]|uniref:tetratricopeptide repeat protein n=1 Tax=Bacillus sp. REN3 TaxID=2802440 RepID=UPI001AEDF09C|nr:tetratricopeptide repeat protein [Bacillus sp. REN3]
MKTQEQLHTPEPEIDKKAQKNDRFNWWQSTLLLVLTLAICLSAGYYISDKYLWEKTDAGQIEEQLKYNKSQVDHSPNDPKLRVDLGYSYFLKKDYDEAIKQFETAKTLDKNYFDAYLNLSIVYDRQDRLNDSLKNAIKAAEISPRDYKGHLMKGISYRKLKMYKESNEALAEADKLKPGNTDIIFEIGMLAEDQGKKDEAQTIYKEALAYDPLYKPALEALDRLGSKN